MKGPRDIEWGSPPRPFFPNGYTLDALRDYLAIPHAQDGESRARWITLLDVIAEQEPALTLVDLGHVARSLVIHATQPWETARCPNKLGYLVPPGIVAMNCKLPKGHEGPCSL